jgi:hypothetical protein
MTYRGVRVNAESVKSEYHDLSWFAGHIKQKMSNYVHEINSNASDQSSDTVTTLR